MANWVNLAKISENNTLGMGSDKVKMKP